MPKKTRKDYAHNWEEIALSIKKRDHWQCQDCGLQFSSDTRQVVDERGKLQTITVHHKDRNHKNNAYDNLITLCSRCHCIAEWPLIHAELSQKKREVEAARGQIFFEF